MVLNSSCYESCCYYSDHHPSFEMVLNVDLMVTLHLLPCSFCTLERLVETEIHVHIEQSVSSILNNTMDELKKMRNKYWIAHLLVKLGLFFLLL